MGKPIDSVGNSDGIGGGDPDLIAAVMVEARADVETSGRVNCKGFSAFGAFMGENFDAGWSQWGLVEVERTVNLSVCGQLRVETGRTKEVEGERGLREKLIPEVEGKVWMSAA